jgi:hypothetical protein
MSKQCLLRAQKNKFNEFYTQLEDIENELRHYTKYFKDKVVLCNCDDPEWSNFYYYFVIHFEELQLRKLIATHLEVDKPSYKLEYEGGVSVTGDKETVLSRVNKAAKKSPLKQSFELVGSWTLYEVPVVRSYSGDFRSPECVESLKEADIVVTNPPFSLFREYVAQLMQYGKKFLILGNTNAVTYTGFFEFLRDNKVWVGCTLMGVSMLFDVSNQYADTLVVDKKLGSGYRTVSGVVKARVPAIWYTNLDHEKRHEDLVLYKKYSPTDYSTYDNYDAIEVSQVADIPENYYGVMGVPITFLDKWNPDQFEILGSSRGGVDQDSTGVYGRSCLLNGKELYARLFIRRKVW